mgnify:CR=1 FL=1
MATLDGSLPAPAPGRVLARSASQHVFGGKEQRAAPRRSRVSPLPCSTRFGPRNNISEKTIMEKPILQINSSYNFHYEVVEGVIGHYRDIIGADVDCAIYLSVPATPMPRFKEYISTQYPNIVWGVAPNYAYAIEVTIYPSDYARIAGKDPARHFYISHSYDPAVTPGNVFYLAGMANTNVLRHAVLPFRGSPRKKTGSPVFLVQGNFKKRDARALLPLLCSKQQYPYRLLLVGNHIDHPWLEGWSNVTIKRDLDFIAFHEACALASGILTLVSPATQPDYYSKKLTSSITYARAYGLHAVIDSELQSIYDLELAHTYDHKTTGSFIKAFSRALEAVHQLCMTEDNDPPEGRQQPPP